MPARSLLLAFALASALPPSGQAAEAPPLRFIAPLNHVMPFADFERDRLNGGIVKDLSEAIAQRVGRTAEFLPVPPRRVGAVLAAGEADAVCYVGQGWIDGDFHWSPPVFEQNTVVAARPDVPPLADLRGLANQPVGTVAGYRYRQVDEALGSTFLRDNAPSMLVNLRKLAARRTAYALTEEITLDYHIKLHPGDGLKTALRTGHYPTYCAFTRAHELPLDRLDQAVRALVQDGSVGRILARYR